MSTGNTIVFLLKKQTKAQECNYNLILEDMKKIFQKIGIINEKNDD